MNAEMFAHNLEVSDAEYNSSFGSTGRDIDNRKLQFELSLEFLEKLTRSVVKFSKAIPGFFQLSTGDKENLIKCKFQCLCVI